MNLIFLGQPQQRPPNLTSNTALASQFRQAYPYAMQQRSILQTGAGYVPSLQPNSHRTATQQSQVQTHTPQPTAAFNPTSRGQSSFAFGASTLVQHQPSGVLQQPQSLPSQQQQQQTNGTANSMSSLHAQTSNSGQAPSVASTSDVGLDPNDFPALGSAPANANSSNSNNSSGAGATSYATQAGTGVLLGTGGGSMGTSATGGQARDFTPDDFPALGGQAQTTQQTRDPSNHSSTTPDLSHPPGLNGFQPSEQQQLRQNLLGPQSGSLQQGTPGMLNLGPTQPRNIHPGFQQAPTDAEKQQQRVRFFKP